MKLQTIKDTLLALVVPLLLLVVWEYITTRELVSTQLLPPPRVLFDTWWDMQKSGELALNMKMSLLRVSAASWWALQPAFCSERPWGCGNRRAVFESTVQLFRQVPVVAWIPFLLLWLGIDEWFKIIFISCGALIPMTLKTYDGIKGVPLRMWKWSGSSSTAGFGCCARS